MRFYVESSQPGVQPYLVDLKAWNLNGECGCSHFEFYCGPKLKQRHRMTQEQWDRLPPFVCKHIRAAQQYAFREWLRMFVRGQAKIEVEAG